MHMGGGWVFRGMKHGSYMTWPVTGLKERFKSQETRFAPIDHSVLDRHTGLKWQRNGNPTGRPVDWRTAFDVVRDLNRKSKAIGDDGWRLPNIRELESVVDLNHHSPALSTDIPVKGIQAGYWSSTTSAYEPSYAWVLYFRDGEVGVGYKGLPEFSVWAVKTDKYRYRTAAEADYRKCRKGKKHGAVACAPHGYHPKLQSHCGDERRHDR